MNQGIYFWQRNGNFQKKNIIYDVPTFISQNVVLAPL